MDHAEEAVGKLIIAGGDAAFDLEMAEHPSAGVVPLLKRLVMFDPPAAV